MKCSLLLLILSVFNLTVMGQNRFIGLKGGYSWTNVSTNLLSSHMTQNGFSGGLTYESVNKKKTILGIELLYESRGFINEIIITDFFWEPTGEKYLSDVRYNYFSMPLKVGYIIGNDFFGFGNIGFCPAWLQKATTTLPILDDNLKVNGDSTVVITNHVLKFDFAVLAEIGCGYKITDRYSITTSFRYENGLTSLTNLKYFEKYSIRNYGMTASLGIKYNLSYKSSNANEPTTK